MELKPKNSKKAIWFVVLAVVLVVGAGVGAYFYRDMVAKDAETKANTRVAALQTQVDTLKEQLATAKSTTSGDSSTICTVVRPSATTLANIKASITSGNTAALEGYMASSVNVIYAASEGLGSRTPAQAVSDVTSFIGDTTKVSWNFDLSASVLSSYGKGSYSQYFPATAVVGKSSDSKVMSFTFDCNGKISGVFMAASESVLK